MIPLIKKGYKVTGVDSSSRMLKVAAQKLKDLDLKAELVNSKLQLLKLNRKFDSIMCLFSVMDYIIQKKDIKLTFKNIARHMRKKSLFIFDFWNENAVVGYYSPKKENCFKLNGKMLKRSSTTKIYPSKRLCEVNYTCTITHDGRVTRIDKEKHTLRYFAINEMQDYLESAGFKVVDVHPFLNIGGKIKKNTWDVAMVARKA